MLYNTSCISPNWNTVSLDQYLPIPPSELAINILTLFLYEFNFFRFDNKWDNAVFIFLCLAYVTDYSTLQFSSKLSQMRGFSLF